MNENYSNPCPQSYSYNNEVGVYAVMFVIFGIIFGSIYIEINKKIGIPYLVSIMITGFLVGYYHEELPVIGISSAVFSNINPKLIQIVFLPILIFEKAFNSDYYVFKRELVNILLLVGPGLIFLLILHSFCFKVVLQFDWLTWKEALLLGIIFCPTISVNFVTMLQEMGASNKFITLIQGEGLVNGGISFFLFRMILEVVKENQISSDIIVISGKFIYSLFGGVILGIIFGIVGSIWLRRIIRDDIMTTTITFVCCYTMFYVAQFTWVQVSGNISLIVLGLFMSAFGKTNIYSESSATVHNIWNFIMFCMSAVIVLLIGNFIGTIFLKENILWNKELVSIPLFYLLMNGSRFIMIYCFSPLLKRSGYGITKKQSIILAFAGNKGSSSLIMAAMIYVDPDLRQNLKDTAMFFVGGIVIMSCVINYLLCRWLVSYLKVIEHPPIKYRILDNSIKELIIQVNEKLDAMKANQFLHLANWEEVKQLIGQNDMQQTVNKLSPLYYAASNATKNYQSIAKPPNQSKELGTSIAKIRSSFEGISQQEILSETRFRLIRIMKGFFWKLYKEGGMSASSFQIIDEACDISLDDTQHQIELWHYILQNFTKFKMIKIFFRFKDVFLIGKIAQNLIMQHLALTYATSSAFIQVAHEAQGLEKEFPIQKEFVQQVFRELTMDICEAEHYISDLSETFPDILRAIHTKRAAMSLLEAQRKGLIKYKNQGFIDNIEYNYLRNQIDICAVRLENKTLKLQLPEFNIFEMEFPVFNCLSPEQLEYLQANSRNDKIFEKDTGIYQKGDQLNYIYVILEGTVEEKIGESFLIQKGVGSFLNYANAISMDMTSLTSAKSLTKVKLKCLALPIITLLMQRNIQFKEKIYMNSLFYFIKIHWERAGELFNFDEKDINHITKQSNLISLSAQQYVELQYGGYLFHGRLRINQSNTISSVRESQQIQSQSQPIKQQSQSIKLNVEQSIIHEFSFIPSSCQQYYLENDSTLIRFNKLIPSKQVNMALMNSEQLDLVNQKYQESMQKADHFQALRRVKTIDFDKQNNLNLITFDVVEQNLKPLIIEESKK